MEQYESGAYCNDVRCDRMRPLVPLRGNEYYTMKKLTCGDCSAWNFYNWLQEKRWSIRRSAVRSDPARMQAGFGNAGAESPSDEEASAIRSLFI